MSATKTITIGGSEAASACGIDPYRSRVQLWLEKLGRWEEDRGVTERRAEAMEWGNLLEPLIAAEVEAREGYEVHLAGDSLQASDYPFMHGHADGLVVVDHAMGVLEIKTAGLRQQKAWWGESVPPPYVVQCQHYLVLTGLEFAIVACLIGGQQLVIRRVERDEGLIALMLQLEEEFVGYVDRDEPPPPDGSDAATEALKHLYPAAREGLSIQLTADDAGKIERYQQLRRSVKGSETQMEQIKQELQVRLGDAELALYEGRPAVRWPTVNSNRLDLERLKTELPNVYEEYLRPSSYRRFTVV